jgi:hypothetical protein
VVREIPTQQTVDVPDELLPLDLPERVVVFRQRDQTKRHIFRRIASADWVYYFSHCFSEVKREAAAFADSLVGMDYAALQLYRRAILRVEGYGAEDGGETTNWQESVPRKHRLSAATILMHVRVRDDSSERQPNAQSTSISVEALWTQDRRGLMAQFRGLVHIFAKPTDAHLRRYDSAKQPARLASMVSPRTTVNPTEVFAALYDELIESVRGYSVGGRPLARKSKIISEMDFFHKCFVTAKLFERASEVGSFKGGR